MSLASLTFLSTPPHLPRLRPPASRSSPPRPAPRPPSGPRAPPRMVQQEGDSIEFSLHPRSRPADAPGELMALLPFVVREVFLPGEVKTLHIYEARWLRLFEEVLAAHAPAPASDPAPDPAPAPAPSPTEAQAPAARFVHAIVAPERRALAAHAVLVEVLQWRRLDLGVQVQIAGVGRVKVAALVGGKPFMRGLCTPLSDDHHLLTEEDTCRLEATLWQSIRKVLSLALSLGLDPLPAREKSQQTPQDDDDPQALLRLSPEERLAYYKEELKAALKRAAGGRPVGADLKDRLEALSFAAFMMIDASLAMKQKAIECKDTKVRVEGLLKSLEETGNQFAARLALKNAFAN